MKKKTPTPSLPAEELLLVTPSQLEALPTLTPALLAWYRANHRSLPWRDQPEPYRVWISEIMLQQTRVEAVKGYFARFLQALPTVHHLADVPEDALLKLWEGLGYYNRARNLQRAAQVVCREYGGRLPASYAQLLELPGIGEYTAGAVASIAFGIPLPAVDGNVYRVISRILGSYADTSLPPVKSAFRTAVSHMIPGDAPGDFNQSLMELGATVCLPVGAPLCERCPVSSDCAAFQGGYPADLPVKAEKKPRRIEERTLLFLRAGERLLLFRRKEKGLLAGMYQPINLEGHLSQAEIQATLTEMGATAHHIQPMGTAKHLFTHVEWRMEGYLIDCPPFPSPDGIWAEPQQLAGNLAIPSAFQFYFKQLRK